jgi:hypothetical protein
MNGRTLLLFALSLILAAQAFAQSAGTVQKLLDKEATKLESWGHDEAIVAAVRAQNAKEVPLAEIKAIDERWVAGKANDTVQQILSAPCSARLHELIGTSGWYDETFAMDDQGALVCATEKTTDYWQGDEAKWQRSFDGGKGATFIDRPRFDESSSQRLAQISVPVFDKDKVIGAITIGVLIDKVPH